MTARFGDIPDFFDNDPLVLDLSPLQRAAPKPQSTSTRLLAAAAQLPRAAGGGARRHARPDGSGPGRGAGRRARGRGGCAGAAARERNARARTAAPAAPDDAPRSALVIDKPLRSGQQVYARGRDLVVLAW